MQKVAEVDEGCIRVKHLPKESLSIPGEGILITSVKYSDYLSERYTCSRYGYYIRGGTGFFLFCTA